MHNGRPIGLLIRLGFCGSQVEILSRARSSGLKKRKSRRLFGRVSRGEWGGGGGIDGTPDGFRSEGWRRSDLRRLQVRDLRSWWFPPDPNPSSPPPFLLGIRFLGRSCMILSDGFTFFFGSFGRTLILTVSAVLDSWSLAICQNPRSRKSALGEIQESRLGERGGVCGCWSCYAELVGTMWAEFGREREGIIPLSLLVTISKPCFHLSKTSFMGLSFDSCT